MNFIEEHHKAFECDLMRAGYELRDVGRSLSWSALRSFTENLGLDSCTVKDLDPELYDWTTTLKTNRILADIYDILSMINSNLVAVGSKKKAKKPKLYPRIKKPGDQIGKGAVAPVQLRQMFANKRRKRKTNG